MNNLKDLPFSDEKIASSLIFKSQQVKVMQMALKTGQELKTHTTPIDALLLVVEGELKYSEGKESITLKQFDTYQISANVPHSVIAINDSRMLLIR